MKFSVVNKTFKSNDGFSRKNLMESPTKLHLNTAKIINVMTIEKNRPVIYWNASNVTMDTILQSHVDLRR